MNEEEGRQEQEGDATVIVCRGSGDGHIKYQRKHLQTHCWFYYSNSIAFLSLGPICFASFCHFRLVLNPILSCDAFPFLFICELHSCLFPKIRLFQWNRSDQFIHPNLSWVWSALICSFVSLTSCRPRWKYWTLRELRARHTQTHTLTVYTVCKPLMPNYKQLHRRYVV